MDGEAEIVSGCTHRENKRSYKDFLMDVEDLEEAGSDAEEHRTKMLHQVHYSGNHVSAPSCSAVYIPLQGRCLFNIFEF